MEGEKESNIVNDWQQIVFLIHSNQSVFYKNPKLKGGT
jgi:hypothetical protein